jgi:hypothetical protein
MLGVWAVVLTLLVPAAWAQGNGNGNGNGKPDRETPATEDVCDILKGATPGLYGLCIAFCEAQDCEPDFSLVDPFENCPGGSQQVLDNYNRKKTETDPEMPCILQTPCPCWTEEELATLGDAGTRDSSSCESKVEISYYSSQPSRELNLRFSDYVSGDSYSDFTVIDYPDGSYFDLVCRFYQSDPSDYRRLQIDEEQYQACSDQLRQHATEWSFSCFD